MLEPIQKIKDYTEAGIILEHMYLFDELEKFFKPNERILLPDVHYPNEIRPGDIFTVEGVLDSNGNLLKMIAPEPIPNKDSYIRNIVFKDAQNKKNKMYRGILDNIIGDKNE